MFRKLYWVTEILDSQGQYRLLGVYTSIPNLIKSGLGPEVDQKRLRLNLTKLDCTCGPVVTWSGDDFYRLESDLAHFIATEEISAEHCKALVGHLAPVAAKK